MQTSYDDGILCESPVIAPTRSLRRFWAPRYWPAWLLVAWLRFTACLPWRLAIRIHKWIGRVCWRLLARHRRIVEANLAEYFPELDEAGVKSLVRGHFESLGACLAEAAFAWFGKVDQSRIPFEIEGDEHVFAALAKGQGVILYTGHFTSVEIFAPILTEILPAFGFMFHARRNLLIDEMQRRGRMHSGHLSFERHNVRAMLRALKRNAAVWYAPDLNFSNRSSIVLPFLGKPTTVSTATCRLARVSGAAVIPFFYQRLPDDSGYVLRFEPALDMDDSEDEAVFTGRLLGVLERFVRQCPEQYAWTHQRLKHATAKLPEMPCLGSSDQGARQT